MLLVGTLFSYSSAQNVPGLTAVGNGGVTPTSSLMSIDATQFITGTDMCGAIATACSKLGTTIPNYPLGATIDARGFTGIQVCLAGNITTMLSACVGGSGHNGGKLLLGDVNLYADGPTGGITGNYSDGHGSGIGTPALIIPAQFWGIEGISRGGQAGSSTTDPGPGTFLSVCTGVNTPVNGCSTAFPQRSFTVLSTSVSTVSGLTTMSMTISPVANFGTNIYPGELVMMRGNTITPTENGTYAVQNGSPDTTVKVTVPSTMGSCTPGVGMNCGTLYLGTPILGFGPRAGKFYNAPSSTCSGNCSSFGMHIKNLGFNCQGSWSVPGSSGNVEGCIGWQNLYAQEESGADTFQITNFSFVGFDSHGNNAQNFGPIMNAEILTGSENSDCDYGTTGGYIGGIAMRGFDNWTINTPAETGDTGPSTCPHTPRAALILDAQGTETRHGHCENFSDCVLLGANNANASGLTVNGIVDSKPGANAVEISNNNRGLTDFVIENVQNYQGSHNTVQDDINGVTLTNPFLSIYSWSSAGSGFVNLVTTDTNTPSRFPTGIGTGLAPTSGAPTNTDLAGQCTIPLGGSCMYTFRNITYANPPICTCSDTSAVLACGVTVTHSSITLAGMTGHKIDYICVSTN